tara:strand:- start:2645 stop:3163 length:519 start_codon:yes stop_codon:yes gene_type:complete
MSFTPSFQVGQNSLYPNIVVVIDNSTGSDFAITQRRVYVQDSAGNYLVPEGTTTDYTQWNIGDASISLNILTEDMAVSVRVDWLDVSNTILYTLTQQFCLALYSKQFFYYLIQLQGLTPSIPADTNYNNSMALFWATVNGAINAVTLASDISASQNSLNRATFMRLNQSLFF